MKIIQNQLYKTIYDSPLGKILLSSDGEFLTGLSFITKEVDKKMIICNELPIFNSTFKWLDEYFKGNNPSFNIPINIKRTKFQEEVFEILATIPYGKVITYGEIAKQIALKRNIKRMSSQAVGHAIGNNPISIIIPCHRVIGINNNLTGYASGILKKTKLLELEGLDINQLKLPKNDKFIF